MSAVALPAEGYGARLFGDGFIFFPRVVAERNGFVEWRDPHVCFECGALVLLPQAHIQFHLTTTIGAF